MSVLGGAVLVGPHLAHAHVGEHVAEDFQSMMVAGMDVFRMIRWEGRPRTSGTPAARRPVRSAQASVAVASMVSQPSWSAPHQSHGLYRRRTAGLHRERVDVESGTNGLELKRDARASGIWRRNGSMSNVAISGPCTISPG